jgi:hypothetical protein
MAEKFPQIDKEKTADILFTFAIETQARHDYFKALSHYRKDNTKLDIDFIAEIEKSVTTLAQILIHMPLQATYKTEIGERIGHIGSVGADSEKGVVFLVREDSHSEPHTISMSDVKRFDVIDPHFNSIR